MSPAELRRAFQPVLADITSQSTVADSFVDKNVYQLYLATLWANVVLNPVEIGIEEADLAALHDVLNEAIAELLGAGAGIRSCFQFVNSKAGEAAMSEADLSKTHRELLLYFSSMILDPEGHKRWMDEVGRPDP